MNKDLPKIAIYTALILSGLLANAVTVAKDSFNSKLAAITQEENEDARLHTCVW